MKQTSKRRESAAESDDRLPPPFDAPVCARILIVDDDERNAFAAVQALEDLGHELVVARSGPEALRRMLTDEFAVVLLDVHMPDMDGYETAALIRARKRTSDVPIVFLTAVFRDEQHLFQAYSTGAIDVVFKPVDPFVLRTKVSVLVDLYLKTETARQESEYRRWLLEEHARVSRQKASAERELEKTRAQQQAILATLPLVITSRSVEPPFAPLFVSDNVERLTGFTAEQFTADARFGFERVHPDDQDKVRVAFESARRIGSYSVEFRWLHADGQYRCFLDQGVLGTDDDSAPVELHGALLDVSERRVLEEQLTHARKMESVGQLTGGVAHDFNNLLTVILGNIDMLMRNATDPRQQRQLSAVRHAAERGGSLTRQLLAFSRRQHLQPATLDANQLIADFVPLIRQAVGEAVTLKTEFVEEPAPVHVDPAQLETALLNLAVNARDAMQNGGSITLRTRRAEAGEVDRTRWQDADEGPFVCVEVCDTGSGMTPEVIEQIFEPFFTTKDVGKGSGLGLSQVYGFVRQSGGIVTVDSKLGHGSTFRLYLRHAAGPVAARTADTQAPAAVGGSEHVLVVEDDETVLRMTVEMLEDLGYRVTTAHDAKSALALLGLGETFDLLFSDVIMPGGVNGVELADRARKLRPELKILLTSGYVGEHPAMAEDRYPLIDKPFEREALAARLRELLDAEPPPRRRSKGAAARQQASPAAA